MMQPFPKIALLILFMLPVVLWANDNDESIDTLELAEVVVEGKRVLVPPGFKSHKLDTSRLQRYHTSSLNQVLAKQPSLNFKNYGPSNIATPTFRGTSASHTAIYWDGIALNSPTLGSIDFSLVQTAMFGDMEVHYGGSSLVDGSGALGGAVHLDNDLSWSQPLSITAWQTAGSFLRFKSGLSTTFGTGDWKGKTSLFYKRGQNDFSYVNPTKPNNPTEIQEHAQEELGGLLQQLHYRLDGRNALSFKAWIQKSDRQIPPTLAEERSEQTQQDFSSRLIAGWNHQLESGFLRTKAAYLYNETNFQDGARQIDANTTVHSLRSVTKFRWQFANGMLINSRLNLTHDRADTDGYSSVKERTRGGFYGGLVYEPLKDVRTTVSLRQEAGRDGLSPFLPAIGLAWQPFDQTDLTVIGNMSRNYRVPTMNDLYWEPGGNEDLDHEKSWTIEGGLSCEKAFAGVWRLKTDLTGFHSRITNWIQWQPTSKGYWEAQNLKTVWTAGAEANVAVEVNWERVSAFTRGGYSFTRSVNMTDEADAMKEADQLIYVPSHQYNVDGGFRWKGLSFVPSVDFTGKRYVSTDNSSHLPAYSLVNIKIGKDFRWPGWQFNLSLTGHNLMNTRYFSVVNRPVPGRWIEAKVQVRFLNKN